MKKFLAVYLGSQTGANFTKWKSKDEATQKKAYTVETVEITPMPGMQ